MAATYAGMSLAEIARRFGTSPQNFNEKLKRNSFSDRDMGKIADVLNAKYVVLFKFKDGTEV